MLFMYVCLDKFGYLILADRPEMNMWQKQACMCNSMPSGFLFTMKASAKGYAFPSQSPWRTWRTLFALWDGDQTWHLTYRLWFWAIAASWSNSFWISSFTEWLTAHADDLLHHPFSRLLLWCHWWCRLSLLTCGCRNMNKIPEKQKQRR